MWWLTQMLMMIHLLKI
jgi:hypothetical protein